MIIRATSEALTAIVSTIVVLSVGATSAMGGPISIDPTNGVTAWSEENSNYDDDSIVDGSGLGGLLHGTATADMWLSRATSGYVVFDLGAVYSITNIRVWNYNQAGQTDRGGSNVVVQYGTNLTFGYSSAFESTLSEVTNFAKASGAAGEPGEAFDSFAAFEAQYILFDITENHGDAQFTGLSEVQFYGAFVRTAGDPPSEITNVTVESVSSQYSQSLSTNTVNGTGLNILGHHTHNQNSHVWLSWLEDLPEIVYDLGDVYDVEMIEVWNYNLRADRGVDGVDILGSLDGTNFSAIASTNFTVAPVSSSVDFSQTVPVTETARYIKLNVTSGRGDVQYTGLSEIKFYGELQAASSPGTLFIFQ